MHCEISDDVKLPVGHFLDTNRYEADRWMVCDIDEVGALQMPVAALVLCIDTRHIAGIGETALFRMSRVIDDGAAEITKGALRLAHQVRKC